MMAQENVAVSYSLKTPAQNGQTQLSVEEQIVRLINRDFFASTNSIKKLHDWLDDQCKYKALGIVTGRQGAGKSIGLKVYKNPNGDRRLRRIPLYSLYLEVLPTWTIRDICVRILELLNHGDRKGNSKNLLIRTWEALVRFGVETLIVDHADELTRKALIGLIRLSLRKETRISLILAGSTELESKLQKKDLDGYFEKAHEFSALSLDSFSDVLLEHFAEDFLPSSVSNTLFDQEIMEKLFQASKYDDAEECSFRHLMNILVRAIVQSSEGQSSLCISKQVLHSVVTTYGTSDRVLAELPGELANAIA